MSFFTRLTLALVAASTLMLATAISASALPEISVTLAGAVYPLSMSATSLTVTTHFIAVGKESIAGQGALLVALLTELGHLGTYEVLFTDVKRGEENCFSEEDGKADPEGELLTKGTWHLAYTSLASSTQGLQLGVLALASPVEIVCGTEVIKVRGDLLASVDTLAGGETEEYTSASGVLTGNGEGLPSIKFFYNEAGASVRAKLEANFGSGFKEAAVELGESATSTTRLGKMFVITSR